MPEVETRRRTRTSTAVKSRYNQRVYDVISIRIPKELAERFKEKCSEKGVSQAGVIRRAIEMFVE